MNLISFVLSLTSAQRDDLESSTFWQARWLIVGVVGMFFACRQIAQIIFG